jgi:adenine/guanine phosphoribosyltransferase-like PRPP-binding protein
VSSIVDYLGSRLKARKSGAPLPASAPPGRSEADRADLRRTLAVIRAACAHRGAEAGRAGCGGAKLYRCEKHACTVIPVGKCLDAARTCTECPDYARPIERPATAPCAAADALPQFSWVSTSQLVADAVLLAGILPTDCAGIVGVPRSGMIAASAIATHLHLPLYTLGKDGPVSVGAGSRGGSLHRAAGPLAVVDDTVYGGRAMQRARRAMGGRPAVYSAVYVRPELGHAVDVFTRQLPSPHLLEWNLFNNGPFAGKAANPWYGAGVALDLDGVIVHDKDSGGKINTPYLVPRAHPVKLIVTGRREKHRTETESLLRSLGVRWERLEMYPDGEPWGSEEKWAKHKARHYSASACGLYVESCPVQAEMILELTGKPVACPVAARVFHTS